MRPTSREERKAVFMGKAEELYEEMERWYDRHEKASFAELEKELRRHRRELMGETLAVLVNGRDAGWMEEKPACPQCGKGMKFEGYRRWGVNGLEGDTALERAYYCCPHGCGEGFSPPGSTAETAGGSLE